MRYASASSRRSSAQRSSATSWRRGTTSAASCVLALRREVEPGDGLGLTRGSSLYCEEGAMSGYFVLLVVAGAALGCSGSAGPAGPPGPAGSTGGPGPKGDGITATVSAVQ